jgi:predicted N-acetyltransferase YhbS
MMKVVIRKEIESDFYDVYELNKAAFGQDIEAKLVDLLRKSPAFVPDLSLVATANDAVVAHILFTKIKIKDENGKEYNSLALAPMAVKPELQKQGIGGQLIRYGLSKARELRHKSVIVVGHEQYYPKFGFLPAGRWKIKAPFDVHANSFMGLELVKDGLKNVTGTVHYPKEFEMV